MNSGWFFTKRWLLIWFILLSSPLWRDYIDLTPDDEPPQKQEVE